MKYLTPLHPFHHTLAVLLKGGREEKAVAKTARDVIASMKRDWMQVCVTLLALSIVKRIVSYVFFVFFIIYY